MKQANFLTYLVTIVAFITTSASAKDMPGWLSAVTINGATYTYRIDGTPEDNIFRRITEAGVPEENAVPNDMACGPNATSLPAAKFPTVEAGNTVNMYWEAGWDWSPESNFFMMYIAPCTDRNCSDGTALIWYKLFQTRLDAPLPEIALISKNATSTDTGFHFGLEIPGTLRPARYLLRHEVVNLETPPSPRFYISCVQIETEPGDQSPVTLFPEPSLTIQFRELNWGEPGRSAYNGYSAEWKDLTKTFNSSSTVNYFPEPGPYPFSDPDTGLSEQQASGVIAAPTATASDPDGTAASSEATQSSVAGTGSQEATSSLSEAAQATDSAVETAASASETDAQSYQSPVNAKRGPHGSDTSPHGNRMNIW